MGRQLLPAPAGLYADVKQQVSCLGTVQMLFALSATAGEDEPSGHYKRPCRAPCEFSTSVTYTHTHTHTHTNTQIHALKSGVNIKLWRTQHYDTQRCRGVVPLILNLGTNGGKWLWSRSGCYTIDKKGRCALNRMIWTYLEGNVRAECGKCMEYAKC